MPARKYKPLERPQKLGKVQVAVLQGLARHGHWPGGWVWDTVARTHAIMETLARRELVDTHQLESGGIRYTINEAGWTALKEVER